VSPVLRALWMRFGGMEMVSPGPCRIAILHVWTMPHVETVEDREFDMAPATPSPSLESHPQRPQHRDTEALLLICFSSADRQTSGPESRPTIGSNQKPSALDVGCWMFARWALPLNVGS